MPDKRVANSLISPSTLAFSRAAWSLYGKGGFPVQNGAAGAFGTGKEGFAERNSGNGLEGPRWVPRPSCRVAAKTPETRSHLANKSPKKAPADYWIPQKKIMFAPNNMNRFPKACPKANSGLLGNDDLG